MNQREALNNKKGQIQKPRRESAQRGKGTNRKARPKKVKQNKLKN